MKKVKLVGAALIIGVLMANLTPLVTSSLVSRASANVVTVTSDLDTGAGTLRQVLFDAVSIPTEDTLIQFDVSVTHIDLATPLSVINNPSFAVTIDGGNAVTINNDGDFPDPVFQIGSAADNSTNNIIKNLTITNAINAVTIYGDNNRVENLIITGPTDESSCLGEIGIAVGERSDGAPIGTVLTGNEITCYRKGILAINADHLTISQNEIRENNADTSISFIGDEHLCYTSGIEIQGAATSENGDMHNHINNNIIELNGAVFDPDSATGCGSSDFLSAGIIVTDNNPSAAAEYVDISNNILRNNYGSGIILEHAIKTLVQDNRIYKNGTGTFDDDAGNGVDIMCNRDSEVGSQGNLIYRNTIYSNADNGVAVSYSCVDPNSQAGDLLPGSNAKNAIWENSIYSNGRTSSGSHLDTDGIGIDLTADDIESAGHSTQNPYIDANDTDDVDEGGNDVVNTPIITSAEYDVISGVWTVEGTVDLDTASGAVIEMFEVDCSGDTNGFFVANCDADANSLDHPDAQYGYGEGRKFLGRITLAEERASNDWTMLIPVDAGFGGGLLTSTLTVMAAADSSCVKISGFVESDAYLNEDEETPFSFACSTSEFGENFRAQVTENFGILNSFVGFSSVPQGGVQSYLVSFSNTGSADFDDLIFSVDLPVGATYTDGTCYAVIDIDESTQTPCEIVDGEVIFDGGSFVLPVGMSVFVHFEADIDEDADLGEVTTTTSVLTDPEVAVIDSVSTFEIIAATEGGASNLLICTDSDAADASPDATFTIDSDAHTNEAYVTTVHTATFENADPTSGNSEFEWRWMLNGNQVSTGSGTTVEPEDIALTEGDHIVTHVVTDCDGDMDIDVANITATAGAVDTTIVLSKTMAPDTGLQNGDLVTVDITAKSGTDSNPITNLTLDDNFTGLSTTVPVCNFAIDTWPTSSSDECSVTSSGEIEITLPDDGLLATQTLFIRYIASVSGSVGTYTNAVSYVESTPDLDATPSTATTQHTIVASEEACSGSETVNAEFTINGSATADDTFVADLPDDFTFTNANTDGDGDITYHWFVNSELQSAETGNSIELALSEATVVTLVKTDCNGSTDSDELSITFAENTLTHGPFTVLKRTADGKDKYALSDSTVDYEVVITNTDADLAHIYDLTDPIPEAFLATVNVTDAEGGVNASEDRQVIVKDIPIAAAGTAIVKYTLTLEDKNDFPLDGYDLDASAKKTEDDLYFDSVNEASLTTTGNSHSSSNAILGSPNKKFVSLGEDGEIIVELEADKAVVNGSGDDFALFLVDNHVDDADKANEDRKVSVSQDGTRFVRVSSSDNAYDISRTNLSWIKFIKIEDTSDSVAAKAPGTDIEAVCMLNVGVPVGATAQVVSGDTSHQADNEVYIDVTKAFDHPLKQSDCTEEELVVLNDPLPLIKEARTLELPVITPLPTPPAVQLPKTGPEVAAIGIGVMGLMVCVMRRLKRK